jgi:hypothetical protein
LRRHSTHYSAAALTTYGLLGGRYQRLYSAEQDPARKADYLDHSASIAILPANLRPLRKSLLGVQNRSTSDQGIPISFLAKI